MLRASLFHARTVAPQSPGVPNGRPPITRRLVSDQALFELSSCSSHVRRSPRTRPVFPSLETVKHCRRSFRQRASKGWFSSVILVAPSHANPSSSTLLNHASSSMAASEWRPEGLARLILSGVFFSNTGRLLNGCPARMRRHFPTPDPSSLLDAATCDRRTIDERARERCRHVDVQDDGSGADGG